ncbi:ATP synthase subunit gamma, mitochondrial [Sesamum angolense]|uniref:F-ATPase gamma subunit n=1 Tax=Sesamum angolense TaxID=2727404 RepID=A0AAE1WM19_9LAMI|nr:ATP synthase subunit gamma, mitochondrial [Sesamum angolense]
MAMAALRREGRRIAGPLMSPHPVNPLRASLASSDLCNREHALTGVRFISTQVVRNRMKSVRNIQKITKAMKMVAASKLRAIQTRAENSRGLWQPFTALLGDTPSVDVKKNVIVTISSDKGLCGGINSTSVKISRGLHKLNSGPEKESKYVILGEKGKAQLVRDSKKDIELSITELQKNPLNYTQVVEREAEAGENLGSWIHMKLVVMFNAVLENACSEQGARMSAMDSSSRNAGDMLDRLTLTYNRTRQASITTELIEIISGASALEG